MGKGVAGRLLKYFTQAELQTIIGSAQALRAIPPDELLQLVGEFEDLFTEGAGLMDNAKAIEAILEEGLTPDEVDSLLGRRTAFQAYETSIWDRLAEAEPAFVAQFLLREHPQTVAYILSMMPSSFGAKVLLQLPDNRRADIMNRTVNMKGVSPKAAQIIENQVMTLLAEIDAERNASGSTKVADLMNEMDKPQVDTLLTSLEIDQPRGGQQGSSEDLPFRRPHVDAAAQPRDAAQRYLVRRSHRRTARRIGRNPRIGPFLHQPAPAPHDRIGSAERHGRRQSARDRDCAARRRAGSDSAWPMPARSSSRKRKAARPPPKRSQLLTSPLAHKAAVDQQHAQDYPSVKWAALQSRPFSLTEGRRLGR